MDTSATRFRLFGSWNSSDVDEGTPITIRPKMVPLLLIFLVSSLVSIPHIPGIPWSLIHCDTVFSWCQWLGVSHNSPTTSPATQILCDSNQLWANTQEHYLLQPATVTLWTNHYKMQPWAISRQVTSHHLCWKNSVAKHAGSTGHIKASKLHIEAVTVSWLDWATEQQTATVEWWEMEKKVKTYLMPLHLSHISQDITGDWTQASTLSIQHLTSSDYPTAARKSAKWCNHHQ